MTKNLQEKYLKQLMEHKSSVSVYLINGIKLSGHIASFDECVVLLKDAKSTTDQLIYKHAISTIVPGRPTNADNQKIGE